MNKKIIWTIIGMLVFVIAGMIGCKTTQQQTQEVEFPTVRVATNKIPYSAPYIVAKNKGFFQEQGLDVQTQIVGTGRQGLDAVIGKSLEVTFVAETPMVHLGFQTSDVNIFATLGEGFACEITARKDHGILQPIDLKGKKIGTQKGTVMEFMTLEFLEDNGMSNQDVQIHNIGIQEMIPALLRGDLDAILTFEPHTTKATQQLAANAVVFKIDRLLTWNLAARKEFLDNNPETIKKFLMALIKATDYIKANQEETNSIISEFTGLEKEILRKIWDRYSFEVGLKSTLVDLLENQAKWILESRHGEIPNYRALINEKYLQAIAPHRVDL